MYPYNPPIALLGSALVIALPSQAFLFLIFGFIVVAPVISVFILLLLYLLHFLFLLLHHHLLLLLLSPPPPPPLILPVLLLLLLYHQYPTRFPPQSNPTSLDLVCICM